MDRTLILGQKPIFARNAVAALEINGEIFKQEEKNVYISEKYIVTSCYGHLYNLCDIEMYRPNYEKQKNYDWSETELPFCPKKLRFKFCPKDKSVIPWIKIIKKYVNDKSVTNILHFGDSDREGEIIVRIALGMAENKKPVYRIWAETQLPTTILEAINGAKPDALYDNIASAGYTKMYCDWLYDINLTRYLTLKINKPNTVYRIGLAQIAILNIIYNREIEIISFKPKKYYTLASQKVSINDEIELNSKHEFKISDKERAEYLAANYTHDGAKIKKCKYNKRTLDRPRLYSLTTLQNEMSEKHNFSPDYTLELVHDLYEKGFISYPCTPSEYLTKGQIPTVQNIINILIKIGFENISIQENIFNDSKVEYHSAIIPTVRIPNEKEFNEMIEDMRICYNRILYRFLSVFCNDECIINDMQMEILVGSENRENEIINVKGQKLLQKGFLQYDGQLSEKQLPELKENDNVNVRFELVQKETNPPERFTVKTLNQYLENPYGNEMDYEQLRIKNIKDGNEIGTVETRANIIKTLINWGYVILDKTTYKITDKGKELIEAAIQFHIDVGKEKAIQMQQYIQSVYQGKKTTKECVIYMRDEIYHTINSTESN